MAKITLRPREEKRLLAGHLWIFSNEIQSVTGEPASGDTVELYDAGGRFLGVGFYNPHSLIAFRLLSREKETIDLAFWKKRIAKAYEYRKSIYPGLSSFRAVFGESDLLPGLIVDKYDKYLAVQFLSAGLERHRDEIVEALRELMGAEGIIARNDSGLRRLEGLEEKIEMLSGSIPERVQIEDIGCSFNVSLHAGQKTGFFFDQRENRAALAKYAKGKSVVDCYCHTGGFGIYAAKGGATRTVWVDSSGPALAMARENAALNGITDLFNPVEADASEYLASLSHSDEKFDIINLDPPALIKSRKFFPAGYKAYRKLNTTALELLGPGGILATSSCSHNLSPQDFRKMLEEAAARAGKLVRLLELRSQSRDHPILLSMPETEYLKFAVLQVIPQ